MNFYFAKSGRPVPSLTKYSQAIAYLLRGPKLTICSQLMDGSTLTAEADPPISQKTPNFNPFQLSRTYEVKYTMWPGAHRPMLAWSLVQFGSAPSTPACRESYLVERKWLGGGSMRYVRYGEAPWWYGAGKFILMKAKADIDTFLRRHKLYYMTVAEETSYSFSASKDFKKSRGFSYLCHSLDFPIIKLYRKLPRTSFLSEKGYSLLLVS